MLAHVAPGSSAASHIQGLAQMLSATMCGADSTMAGWTYVYVDGHNMYSVSPTGLRPSMLEVLGFCHRHRPNGTCIGLKRRGGALLDLHGDFPAHTPLDPSNIHIDAVFDGALQTTASQCSVQVVSWIKCVQQSKQLQGRSRGLPMLKSDKASINN